MKGKPLDTWQIYCFCIIGVTGITTMVYGGPVWYYGIPLALLCFVAMFVDLNRRKM